MGTTENAAAAGPQRQALIRAIAQDVADHQRLTAQGNVAEVGKELKHLKRKLDQLLAADHNLPVPST